MYKIDWKKYAIVLLITTVVFVAVNVISNLIKASKLVDLREMQNRISIDLLSSETEFALLSEASCQSTRDSAFSAELDNMGTKLAYAEEQISTNSEDLMWLKKNYSLLEIKDYLLMKKLADKCKIKPLFILYFYSNAGDCADCQAQGLILSSMREKYPQLRVYSFDYNLDLPALHTLVSLLQVKKELPALVINGRVYTGLQTMADMEKTWPALKDLLKETTATSTRKNK